MVSRAGFAGVHTGDADGDADHAVDRMVDGSVRRSPADPVLHDGVRRVVCFAVVSDAEFVASVRGLSSAWSGRAWHICGAACESNITMVHGASRIGARAGDVRHGDWWRHLAMGLAVAAGSIRLAQRLCDLRRSRL